MGQELTPWVERGVGDGWGWGEHRLNVFLQQKELNGSSSWLFQLVAIFALPGILMIICYSIVIRELWRSNKNMAILTNNAGR